MSCLLCFASSCFVYPVFFLTFLTATNAADADLFCLAQLLAVGTLGRRTAFLFDLVQGSFTIL